MGISTSRLKGLDIEVLREGTQLSSQHAAELIATVTIQEIREALKGIGDLKAPGMDGFNAKFFKATWNMIGEDTIGAVQEFFNQERMYLAINCSIVTLIPKNG